MSKRTAEAFWIESKNYWQIKVQRDGIRKAFTSSVKGRKGKHIAESKADAWLELGTSEMRFPAAWAAFLADVKKNTGSGNYLKHESIGRLYIAPVIGPRRLSAVTPAMWQQCVLSGADAGLSRRSCQNIAGTIRVFLSYCEAHRWQHEQLRKSDIRIPNSAKPPAIKHVLQPDDIRTLFSVSTFPRYGRQMEAHYIHAWRFFVVTGLRRGELCGLKREDIADGMICVRRSINAQGEVTTGKNDNARRAIVISKVAEQILQDQAAMLRRIGVVSPWVFPDEQGNRSHPNNIQKRWRTYQKHHNIQSNIHELRHTFISINKVDMPLELLKATVGHSSQMDTLGVYGHEICGEKERAAQIIDTVFDRILK